MKVNVNHYTDEFKYKVVQEYLNTDLSQLAERKSGSRQQQYTVTDK